MGSDRHTRRKPPRIECRSTGSGSTGLHHQPRLPHPSTHRARHLRGEEARSEGLPRCPAAHAAGRFAGVQPAVAPGRSRDWRNGGLAGANGAGLRPRSSIAGLHDHPVARRTTPRLTPNGPARSCRPRQVKFAARGGLDDAEFAGATSSPAGRQMANTWQGAFPHQNLKTDGYELAGPDVSPNGYRLDIIGNVWEWTTDWYAPRHDVDGESVLHPQNPRGGRRGELRPLPAGDPGSNARCEAAASVRPELRRRYARRRATPGRSTPRPAMSASAALYVSRVRRYERCQSPTTRLLQTCSWQRAAARGWRALYGITMEIVFRILRNLINDANQCDFALFFWQNIIMAITRWHQVPRTTILSSGDTDHPERARRSSARGVECDGKDHPPRDRDGCRLPTHRAENLLSG